MKSAPTVMASIARALSVHKITSSFLSDGEASSDSDRVEQSFPLLAKPPSLPIVKSVEELNVLSDEDDSDCCLQCFNVPLKHGVNEYNLTAQVGSCAH